MHRPLKLLTATTPQRSIYSEAMDAPAVDGLAVNGSRLTDRHEDPARALRADRTFDHLARVRRLELHALVAALLAFRMILIRDRLL